MRLDRSDDQNGVCYLRSSTHTGGLCRLVFYRYGEKVTIPSAECVCIAQLASSTFLRLASNSRTRTLVLWSLELLGKTLLHCNLTSESLTSHLDPTGKIEIEDLILYLMLWWETTKTHILPTAGRVESCGIDSIEQKQCLCHTHCYRCLRNLETPLTLKFKVRAGQKLQYPLGQRTSSIRVLSTTSSSRQKTQDSVESAPSSSASSRLPTQTSNFSQELTEGGHDD